MALERRASLKQVVPSAHTMSDTGDLDAIGLQGLFAECLPFRTSEHVNSVLEKLGDEEIFQPSDMLEVSEEALDTKLDSYVKWPAGVRCNYMEVADIMCLVKSVKEVASRSSKMQLASRSSKMSKHEHPSYSPRRFRNPQTPPPKPELWAAVEKCDEVLVSALLEQPNANIEEKFNGWSPLMKAAEEGHEGILTLLLEKQADINTKNHKGRTAPSFAAAPSMSRPTPLPTLMLLLEHGADIRARDVNGLTARAHAEREGRSRALEVLNEWEQKPKNKRIRMMKVEMHS